MSSPLEISGVADRHRDDGSSSGSDNEMQELGDTKHFRCVYGSSSSVIDAFRALSFVFSFRVVEFRTRFSSAILVLLAKPCPQDVLTQFQSETRQ